jgi:hypothetical protein
MRGRLLSHRLSYLLLALGVVILSSCVVCPWYDTRASRSSSRLADLYTWTGSALQCIVGQAQPNPSSAAGLCQCNNPQSDESLQAAVSPEDMKYLLENGLSVLFVVDPNAYLCWEEIPLDAFTRETLVRYVYNLKDPLTATQDNPEGDYLKVSSISNQVDSKQT